MAENAKFSRRSYLKAAGSATAALGLAGCAGEEGEFPSDTVTYIVPYDEGGGVDGYARGFAEPLEDALGTSVNIENIPGASAMRGLGELARADDDGYTICALVAPDNIITALADPPDYDIRDLEGVGVHGQSSWMFIANPEYDLEHDLEGMVEMYRNGELEQIGGLGTATPGDAASMVFEDSWDMPNEYVSYGSTAPVVQATVSGEVPVGMATDTGALSAAQSGDVDIIAAQSEERSQVFPDAPTVEEEGLESIAFLGTMTRGILTAPGTPQDRIDVLEDALQEAVESDAIEEWSDETGNPVVWDSASTVDGMLDDLYEDIPNQVDIDSLS